MITINTVLPRVKKYFLKTSLGFTLVELIIVVSILAILGTIGFISIQDFSVNARDSVRVSDLKSLQKGLSIFKINSGKYPLPDGDTLAVSVNNVILYQGSVGEGVVRTTKTNTIPFDPKYKMSYLYSVDVSQKKFQLMGYLESSDTATIVGYENHNNNNPFPKIQANTINIGINEAYADNQDKMYRDGFVYVLGDKVGILTDMSNIPLQETTADTGVTLNSSSTGIIAHLGGGVYDNGHTSGSGQLLINQLLSAQNDTIPCDPMHYNGYAIDSLMHAQTGTFLKSLSIANGSGTSSLQIACSNGILGTASAIETTDITCNANFVNQGNLCVADICTGSVPGNAESTATTQTISQSWARNTTPGICTFDCKTNYTWNSQSNTCTPNTRTASCGTLPTNSTAATTTTYTQTWNGSAWAPSYSWTNGATSCGFTCNTNYTWNGSVCAANTRSVSCGGVVPSYASASTATTYTQIWNGSAWAPVLNWSNGATSCGFACNSTYTWNGSVCAENRVTVTLTISNINNYNIFANRGGTYVAGRTDVVVNVSGTIGSVSVGTPALDTGAGWAAGDTITIVNNGTIIGAAGAVGAYGVGGAGGAGATESVVAKAGSPGSAGGAGGTGGVGLRAQRAVRITNNGTISGGNGGAGGLGGGGGGGGGGRSCGYSCSGNGGTGGKGQGSAAAANGSMGQSCQYQTSGGQWQTYYGGSGGAGGAYGATGIKGGCSGGAGGAAGATGAAGARGAYMSGNAYATWLATGTRTGTVN